MKVERFAGHHEEREALMLSVAGATAIMLIANLVLLILYWSRSLRQQSRRRYAANGFAFVPQTCRATPWTLGMAGFDRTGGGFLPTPARREKHSGSLGALKAAICW